MLIGDHGSALEVRGVSVQFGGLRALSEVDLAVPYGTICGVIGPNGAGKTTLLNAVAGTVPTRAGSIALAGQDISGWSVVRRVRSGLARTFQGGAVFSHLTVAENLTLAVLARGKGRDFFARQREPATVAGVMTLLAQFGLADFEGRLARQLPQGARVALGIAMALQANPKVLLLDEPFAGTTERDQAFLLPLIRQARSQQIGIVLVEHNVNLIVELCDRTTVLDQGRVIAEGPPDLVTRNPAVIEAYLGHAYAQERGLVPTAGEQL